MACEYCGRRGTEEAVTRLERVTRNQGILLLILALGGWLLLYRLNAKGLLPVDELLGVADG